METMDEIRQALTEIYPDVDIDQLFLDQPDKSLAWYADHIVNNIDTVRKRVVQRDPSESPPDSDDSPSAPLVDHVKLKSELIAEYTELLRKDLGLPIRTKKTSPKFTSVFRRLFPQLSKKCHDHILKITGGRRPSSFIIGFFVKNDLLDALVTFIPLPMAFWTFTALETDTVPQLPVTLSRSFKGIKDCFAVLQQRYSVIVDSQTLSINVPVLALETFNCGVCYDDASVDVAISCGVEDPFDDDVIIISSDPCSSTDVRPKAVQHKFCTDCVRRHATAATESMPISDCGTGLKCMEHGCKRPLLFSRIRHVLPKKTVTMLENRILAENLAAFGDIEKCPKCNFAIAMEVSKEEDKVFRCLKCKESWCRLCELPWNDDHFGRSCDETALKTGVDKKKRDLERKANEAVMRKCHRCNLPFTKDEGCNKVTCRCGATQCYICRTKSIDYSHFCRHPQAPGKTRTCCNKCLLWDDANSVDKQAIARVYEEAGEAAPEDDQPAPKRTRFDNHIMHPFPFPPPLQLRREGHGFHFGPLLEPGQVFEFGAQREARQPFHFDPPRDGGNLFNFGGQRDFGQQFHFAAPREVAPAPLRRRRAAPPQEPAPGAPVDPRRQEQRLPAAPEWLQRRDGLQRLHEALLQQQLQRVNNNPVPENRPVHQRLPEPQPQNYAGPPQQNYPGHQQQHPPEPQQQNRPMPRPLVGPQLPPQHQNNRAVHFAAFNGMDPQGNNPVEHARHPPLFGNRPAPLPRPGPYDRPLDARVRNPAQENRPGKAPRQDDPPAAYAAPPLPPFAQMYQQQQMAFNQFVQQMPDPGNFNFDAAFGGQ